MLYIGLISLVANPNMFTFILITIAGTYMFYRLALVAILFTTINVHAMRVVRVGAFNYYPGIFQDVNGHVCGFYVDMLTEIGRIENIEFRYIYGSWSQGLQRLQDGEIDIMPSVAYTPERGLVMDYASQSLLTVWGEIYVPQGSEIKGIMDTRGKTVAVMKGDINAAHFMKLASDFKLNCKFVEYPDFTEVFNAVSTNNAEAGVVNNTFGAPKYKEYGLQASGIIFNPFDIYFAVKKNTNAEILQIIDKYLSVWKKEESSVYNRARQKWSHGNIGAIEVWPHWLPIATWAAVLSISISAVFIFLLKRQVEYATAKIKKSELKFRSYIDNAPDGVCVVGNRGEVRETNRAICHITGHSSDELESMQFHDIYSPENNSTAQQLLENLELLGTIRDEGHIVTKFKEETWVLIDAVRLDKDNVLVFMKDISDKKKIEWELRDRAAEIEEQNEALIVSKSKAEESDRLKSAFLQNLNHEIRTPLNAIMGFSELLPLLITGNPKAEEYCRYIVERSRDLLEIINGTLLIATIESDQIALESSTVVLEHLADELKNEFETMKSRYKKEHLHFSVQYAGCNEQDAVKTDVPKLKMIAINLLSNACKFTLHGIVEICFTRISHSELRIEVRDTGVGIDAEKLPHIFSRFYKIIDAGTPMYDGAGLGLPIAKSLAELLGGSIGAVSEPGKGSVFSVVLPGMVGTSSVASMSLETRKHHGASQVLIVEDDMYNMLLLAQMLERWGISALTASTAERGIELALHTDVSLVLMDVKLPDLSGYEATVRIKEKKPSLPIIAQTGFSTFEDEQQAYRCGMNDYISKPISMSELKEIVHKYIDF